MAQRYNNSAGHTNKSFVYAVMQGLCGPATEKSGCAFKEDAEKAIESKNPHDACIRWQAHFGDRFSCSTAKDEDEDASKKEFSGRMRYNSQYA